MKSLDGRFLLSMNRCGQRQLIPHPMFKYQPDATTQGTASWACHVTCNDYTFWTIVPEDVSRIPPQYIPDSWAQAPNGTNTST